jgi:DNA-binding NtrC family response regulator
MSRINTSVSQNPAILVVDDDQHLGELLQMALGNDWRVILAEDGLQAIECARSESPDLKTEWVGCDSRNSCNGDRSSNCRYDWIS